LFATERGFKAKTVNNRGEEMKSGKNDGANRHQRWAEFRFSIIGHLLANPPEKGELKQCLKELSSCTWRHPISGEFTQFGLSTIERWYYRALNEQSPVDSLRRKIRSDCGIMTVVDEKVENLVVKQYREHPSWSYKLHSDNLTVLIEQGLSGRAPSYSSVKRFMKSKGLFRKKKARNDRRPAAIRAFERSQKRERRLFEAPYPHSLWHLDFHYCSRQIIEPDGRWYTPLCLCVLDDNSRLACHIQWYLAEDTECLVHGFIQAVQKRGLCRELMTDNGSAMKSEEFTSGLKRLGILWSPTLEYSPNQNGKQEIFWNTMENRLVAMVENVKNLTLKMLNDATIAWVDMEYNRATHSEIRTSPILRIKNSKDVSRPSPSGEILKDAFCREVTRAQRRTDGTVKVENTRFEIPSRYRHLEKITLRYAKWDLSWVFIVNPKTGKRLTPIYPVDEQQNATSGRRAFEISLFDNEQAPPTDDMAPLLKKLMADYAASGLPPAYIPKYPEEPK
jgi:transposase InsO family protein